MGVIEWLDAHPTPKQRRKRCENRSNPTRPGGLTTLLAHGWAQPGWADIQNLMPVSISLATMSGQVPWSQFNWQLQAGTVLTCEPNTDTQETVVVQGNAMAGFTATFTQKHAAARTVVSRGNPGPFIQQTYNPANDPLVVLYQTFLN